MAAEDGEGRGKRQRQLWTGRQVPMLSLKRWIGNMGVQQPGIQSTQT